MIKQRLPDNSHNIQYNVAAASLANIQYSTKHSKEQVDKTSSLTGSSKLKSRIKMTHRWPEVSNHCQHLCTKPCFTHVFNIGCTWLLGRFSQVVKMSMYICTYICICPLFTSTFSRSLIGPPIVAKKELIMLVWPILGHVRCSVVTLVTFSSNLRDDFNYKS